MRRSGAAAVVVPASKRMDLRPVLVSVAGAVVAFAGSFGPLTAISTGPETVGPIAVGLTLVALVLAGIGRDWAATLLIPVGLIGAFLTVRGLHLAGIPGEWGYWSLLWGHLLVVAGGVGRVSLVDVPPEAEPRERILRGLLPPATIPFVALLAWQGLVDGYDVPIGIFPGVLDVWRQLLASFQVLLADSYVTFVKEVLLGLTLGLVAGFAVAIVVAASTFLQRGLLPLAAAFGAVPIVGLAPVLGRAFGVDWESKASVVVIVTFFPVVLNTVQGLTRIDPLKLELLRAYAARPDQIFLKLRLPNALPYLFNALKLALVVAVVSVIVAEFLIPGPPEGLGQRISLSARRGSFDVVFAAIVVTSAISIALYGLLSLLERLLTGWHPSMREGP